MTTYFEIQQDAAWSVQENDKWMLFNILFEQFFHSENYVQYNNEKSRTVKHSIRLITFLGHNRIWYTLCLSRVNSVVEKINWTYFILLVHALTEKVTYFFFHYWLLHKSLQYTRKSKMTFLNLAVHKYCKTPVHPVVYYFGVFFLLSCLFYIYKKIGVYAGDAQYLLFSSPRVQEASVSFLILSPLLSLPLPP